MSALDHIDSMDPDAAGNAVFLRARGILEALGFEVRESWSYGTLCDAVVSSGGQPTCRLQFTATPGAYTLNVMPLDETATNIILDLTGRLDHPEPMWQNDELDHFEALFRSLKVREGVLAMTEYPSDYALRLWLAKASTVALPRERGVRRPECQDVVIRPLEAPLDRHPSRSVVSRDIVRTARLLDKEYDRDVALGLALASARQEPLRNDKGTFEDPALAWLAHSARQMIRDRRRQMDQAWNKGSWNRTLFAPLAETPRMTDPMTEADMEPATPAPGP